MAHIVAPKPAHAELPIFFNVDGVVGAPPSVNGREDVLLVQFAFYLIGKTPLPTSKPATTAAAKQVQVTGVCDPQTIAAIRTIQASKGGTVDGRVSPSQNNQYSYGSGVWIISHLNDSMQERSMDVWPRLDKISGCPAELAAMVKRVLIGT